MKHVLMFVIDSLRYDALTANSMPKVWNALVEHGICAVNYYATGHCSDPNFTSIFTGQYPWSHRLLHQANDHQLNAQKSTLMDDLHNLGIMTYARCNFEKWSHRFKQFDSVEFSAETYEATLTTVNKLFQEHDHVFVLLHTDDCHVGDYKVKGGYDKAIRITDDLVSQFVIDIRKKHDPAIIFTADHGEHHMYLHNYNFFPVVIHVPLVISLAKDLITQEIPPVIDTAYAQHIQLRSLIPQLFRISYPTQLDYFTRPLLFNQDFLFFRSDCRYQNTIPVQQFGIMNDNNVLAVRHNTPTTSQLELYDTVTDLNLDHPLQHAQPDVANFLDQVMAVRIPDYVRSPIMDKALCDRLLSLGYLE